MTRIRTYSELSQFHTFEDRFDYLRLRGVVAHDTFGGYRHINQAFYRSYEWQRARDATIFRDNGCDLGVPGYEIYGELVVHHMTPVTLDDLIHGEEWIIDPEYLITTTMRTHNEIHYGVDDPAPRVVIQRTRGDTKLW